MPRSNSILLPVLAAAALAGAGVALSPLPNLVRAAILATMAVVALRPLARGLVRRTRDLVWSCRLAARVEYPRPAAP